MDVRDLIRQISEHEPLNPYQVAGMASVITRSGVDFRAATRLEVEALPTVLMVLDRTGEEASPFLVAVSEVDSCLRLFPRFPRESLGELVYLTSFKGRRQAIEEHLIPVVYEIPNWLDLVRALTRYFLDRDDEAIGDRLDRIMEIILSFLFAATRQPFDAEARSEGEYALSRLVESVLRSSSDGAAEAYLPFVERCLSFMISELVSRPLNSFERRIIEVSGIRSALSKRPDPIAAKIGPLLDKMAAQVLITALGEIEPCPPDLLGQLATVVAKDDFPHKEAFKARVLDRINRHSREEIDRRCGIFRTILQSGLADAADHIRQGQEFIRSVADEWSEILSAFQDMVEALPPSVQAAFSEILVVQILAIHKPDVKQLLINGLCEIVIRVEKSAKRASRELVDRFATLFLDRAYASEGVDEVISSFKAVESLGVALGRNRYFLMARELEDHLIARPLIMPRQKKYTIEDDDTGQPLVLAEDVAEYQGHVQQIKSLLAIIASNPRIMRRLTAYLLVQLELRGTRLCDEDFIQYSISALLRANSPITHFMTRTLIKAIPYSFKDIGPLDTLRLTAAGLAKELADRGVKPIGNFLGKLRGDIHWRGSIENYYFCQGILRYFRTGRPEEMAEWMPPESLPYLAMSSWCSLQEEAGIRDLVERIFADYDINPAEKDSLNKVVFVDASPYANDETWPQFSRRVVLDVVALIKGLHTKYFIVAQSEERSSVEDDLERLGRIIADRREIKDRHLVPDVRDPLPRPVTLTEGTEDQVREMDRIRREQPDTPIILRAKKAGHAYAQKAVYIEDRFEAFNKDLQLEALQETLATSISNTHLTDITLENLPHALRFLNHLVQGVSENGHSSYYLEQAGKDLRHAGALGLTFDKVRDLVKIIKRELDDVHDFYRFWFEEPFELCIAESSADQLPRKLRDLTTLKEVPDKDFFYNYLKTLYISDLQARDGNLRVLESFIDKVELFLNQRLAESGRLVVPGVAAPGAAYFSFPDQGELSSCWIGQKAAMLAFAENTPPYFSITTAAPLKEAHDLAADSAFRNGLAAAVAELEVRCGRHFGDASRPALFSVRSGARVSMPGMMITITNVGINDETAQVLAEEHGQWFAYDCYRRFMQEFGQSVFGVGREEFQDLMDERKARWSVNFKAEMSGPQMKELAFAYKNRLGELAPRAVEMLDNGRFLDILIYCAATVLHSHESAAAVKYRQAAGIDGNWRTPVIVQSMVYGNLDFEASGTGVVAYNPFTMEWRGDFASADQGTDVVGGKVATIPTYDLWKRTETLASRMPEAWKQLSSLVVRAAERLHLHITSEYTIEKGVVYILQIRKNRERKERVPSLEEHGYQVIGRGTGVSGRIFRGIMVTNREQIAPYRHINKAQSIIDAMNKNLPENEQLDGFIFVVNDPIPEEIMEEVFSLPVPTALVSRLGGRGAHAADIAKSLRKVYVGQVGQLRRFSGRAESVAFNDIEVIVGSKLIIHGQTGEIALYRKASV